MRRNATAFISFCRVAPPDSRAYVRGSAPSCRWPSRPHAREVRRTCGLDGHRHEGELPRTYAREYGGATRQKEMNAVAFRRITADGEASHILPRGNGLCLLIPVSY